VYKFTETVLSTFWKRRSSSVSIANLTVVL